MGLLDSLFDQSQYGDQTGGLLSRLSQLVGTQDQYQPSMGFAPQSSPFDNAPWPQGPGQPPASFADRFNAMPGAPQPFQGSNRQFDQATFDPSTYAPNQAQPIAVGNYQMPRMGSADQFSPAMNAQAALPPNAQPTQGQIPTQPAPPQAEQPLPPAFGGGGGIASALGRIGNPDGLIARLTGNDSRSVAQQNLTAQYHAVRQALIANGENPQAAASKAMIAAMNPEAAKTILPELFTTKEKFQKTGQDPLTGVEQFGFVNERDQTVNGRPMGSQPSNSASIGDPSLTGDAYLKSLPEGMQAQVKAIVEGRMQPPSGFALKFPQIQALVRAAAQYEPGFDMTKWSQRVGTVKDFASGQAAKNVTSLNTVIGHLSDLKEKADALNNWSVPAINTVGNAINNATGGPEVNNFNLARNAVADELAKVFKGSGISDHEIAQWKETLNASQSPTQLKGAVKTAIGLMDSRLSALTDQRDRGMSTQSEPRSLLNEKSKAGLAKIEDWAGGTGKSEAKAGGVQEGATATNPQTGAKLTLRNGKWQ